MDELTQDYFPKICRSCYGNCFHCSRKIGSAKAAVIRELASKRKLKLQAICRMQREVYSIEKIIDYSVQGEQTCQ